MFANDRPARAAWITLICGLGLTLFIIRLSGLSDLEGYAQHRNIGYVLDAIGNGNWLAQYDMEGRILSKPPLHTWLAAGSALLFGIDRPALALPSLLSIVALSVLVFEFGRRRFGLLAGGLAGVAVVMAPMVTKHIALLRSDPLFALLVALAALAALRAWEQGGRWLPFWLAAGLATLTKGPLALVLAAGGLLAWFWERRTDSATPPLRGSQWAGVLVFLAIPLIWFLAAWWHEGQALIDKMLRDELLGHATGVGRDSQFGANLLRPTLFFLQRFLPFSLFSAYAVWRVFRHPAADAGERRVERFLTCWILAGLLIFSLAAHHRPDLLLPLWAPAALLAGREMAALAKRIGVRYFALAAVVLVGLLLIAAFDNYHARIQEPDERNLYSENIRAAARSLGDSGLDVRQLLHADTPVTLQMYLGTHRRWLTAEQLDQLRREPAPGGFLIAVEAVDPIRLGFDEERFVSHLVFSWASSEQAPPLLRVYNVRSRVAAR